MKKFPFIFAFLLVFALFLSSIPSYSAEFYYATTDMTWAEFYAGETNQTAKSLEDEGLDAITSPTTNAISRFPLLVSASNDNGSTISGVKDVQVRMSEEVYNTLKNNSRFTFVTTEFSEYKDALIDGTFGKMQSEISVAENAKVELLSGASSTWGNYMLNILSADIDIGLSGDKVARNYLGATLETSDGKIYGLRHDCNLWSDANHIAFCINADYVEPHGRGIIRDYDYTESLEGKTITKVTYMLKNIPDVVINCNVKVKSWSDSSINSQINADNSVKFEFTNTPDDANYKISSVYIGSGRNRTFITDYTYENNTLTFKGEVQNGNYTAVFSSENYSDISATFKFFHYATTDMTWAEFYAGETNQTAKSLEDEGLDAITSPTTNAISRFPLLVSASNDEGSTISGVKDVQVRMTEAVYNVFKNNNRYTFTESTFSEYKDVDENGSFGKMQSEISVAEDAKVELLTSASSTWGNYMLNILSADIDIGLSGDKVARNYLGATLETSDGTIYGLRHDCNLWSDANHIAFCINDKYVEPHGRGIIRDYDYTESLEGKTITKVTYMLKNIPDVVINCNVTVKKWTDATVKAQEPETGFIIPLTGVEMQFNNAPSDADYKISSVYMGSGRNRTFITDYEFKDNILTVSGDFTTGNYTAVFSSENYVDIAATFTVYTTDATNLIMTTENNAASLNFLLTPKGASTAVDEELEKNNFVNASDYTTSSDNYSVVYSSGTDEIADSGFSFDIALKDVPTGKIAVVGFGKIFNLTPQNCGTERYNLIYSTINAMPIGESGFREISDGSVFKTMGLKVMSVQPDGTTRDITEFTGAGAMIIDSSTIMIFYGIMTADCDSGAITEGEYTLSPEGETLLCDGKKDNHLTAVLYFAEHDMPVNPPSPTSPDVPAPTSPDVPTPTSPDNPGGESSGLGKEYKESETPSSTLQSNAKTQTVIDNVVDAIEESFPSLPDSAKSALIVLPDIAKGDNRELTSSELNVVSDDDDYIVLETMKVTKNGIYYFKVPNEDLEAGDLLSIHMFVTETRNTARVTAKDEDSNAVFINDKGEVITTVPEKKDVNVAAYMKADVEYTPVISISENEINNNVIRKGSSSGCNSGLFAGLTLTLLFLILKRNS